MSGITVAAVALPLALAAGRRVNAPWGVFGSREQGPGTLAAEQTPQQAQCGGSTPVEPAHPRPQETRAWPPTLFMIWGGMGGFLCPGFAF